MPNAALRQRTVLFCAVAAVATLAGTAPSAFADDCFPFEEPKLTAPNGAAGDRFGIAVSIHGDLAVSGAYLKSVAGIASGATFVYRRGATGAWVPEAQLVPSDGGPGDWFGVSVATDGERVLVGAQNHDGAGANAGAAYVYREDGGSWVEEAKLVAPAPGANDWMGHSVSLAEDLAVAGAHLTDGPAADTGAVHVFRRDGTGTWTFEAALTASDPEAASEFGSSVGTDGTSVVVGARWKDETGPNSGAAYVYRRVAGVWTEEAELVPADPASGDEFGFEVAVDGDRAVCAARLEDEAGVDAGALYVFVRDETGAWSQEAKLVGGDLAADDRFGEGLSIDGGIVVGGARQHDAAAADGGAAYVFVLQPDGTWTEEAKLVGSDVGPMHFFGISADVQDGRAIIGADLDSELGSQAGSAYVYELNCAGPDEVWQTLRGGVGGVGGIPGLSGIGELVGGGSLTFVLDGAPPGAFGALVLGLSAIDAPLFGGTLVPSLDVLLFVTPNDEGAAQLVLPLPGSLAPGLQVWAQAWFEDPTAPQGFTASDAVMR